MCSKPKIPCWYKKTVQIIMHIYLGHFLEPCVGFLFLLRHDPHIAKSMYCHLMVEGIASNPKSSRAPLKTHMPTQGLVNGDYDLLKCPTGGVPHLQTLSLCFSLWKPVTVAGYTKDSFVPSLGVAPTG